MLPPVDAELPVPLAAGALLEADGLVLALPLEVVPVPGALSLMLPLPLVDRPRTVSADDVIANPQALLNRQGSSTSADNEEP